MKQIRLPGGATRCSSCGRPCMAYDTLLRCPACRGRSSARKTETIWLPKESAAGRTRRRGRAS